MSRRFGDRAQLGAASARVCAAALLVAAAGSYAFDLEGHRGARCLAPENTLAGFRTALGIGVTTLETDMQVTRDGVIVISHNARLNPDITRGPDGKWLASEGPAIHALNIDEVAHYDVGRINPASAYARDFPEQIPVDGQRIPTLAELLALVQSSGKPVRLNIETKLDPNRPDEAPDPIAFASMVVDAVQTAGMQNRVVVQSFDWRTLVQMRKLAPDIPTSCLTIETSNTNNVRSRDGGASAWTAGLDLRDFDGSLPKMVKKAGCRIWSPFWRNVSTDRVDEAHALGLTVLPWTVNDPKDMQRLIDLNVDGIITDYPDRLRNVLGRAGYALP